jgi:hypothetical protein
MDHFCGGGCLSFGTRATAANKRTRQKEEIEVASVVGKWKCALPRGHTDFCEQMSKPHSYYLKSLRIHGSHSDTKVKLERLKSLLEPEEIAQKDKVLAYLKSGHFFAHYWHYCSDLLKAERTHIEQGSDVFTDSVWSWTGEVTYYVEKYNLRLPAEFLSHMELNDWKVPPFIKGGIPREREYKWD